VGHAIPSSSTGADEKDEDSQNLQGTDRNGKSGGTEGVLSDSSGVEATCDVMIRLDGDESEEIRSKEQSGIVGDEEGEEGRQVEGQAKASSSNMSIGSMGSIGKLGRLRITSSSASDDYSVHSFLERSTGRSAGRNTGHNTGQNTGRGRTFVGGKSSKSVGSSTALSPFHGIPYHAVGLSPCHGGQSPFLSPLNLGLGGRRHRSATASDRSPMGSDLSRIGSDRSPSQSQAIRQDMLPFFLVKGEPQSAMSHRSYSAPRSMRSIRSDRLSSSCSDRSGRSVRSRHSMHSVHSSVHSARSLRSLRSTHSMHSIRSGSPRILSAGASKNIVIGSPRGTVAVNLSSPRPQKRPPRAQRSQHSQRSSGKVIAPKPVKTKRKAKSDKTDATKLNVAIESSDAPAGNTATVTVEVVESVSEEGEKSCPSSLRIGNVK